MRSTKPWFHLRMLGGLQLADSAGCVEGRAAQRKRLLLLALLATSERGVTRAKLASLLWPERSEERARKALSDALYVLRSELGDEVVHTSGDDVELGSAIDTDVSRFECAVERGDLDEAVRLYRGPFLDGVQLPGSDALERWAEIERERLMDVHSRSLERAALDAGDRGEWREAVGWWRRLSAHEPYNSRVVAGLMNALARSGASAQALREARAHELRLRDELGVEPDPVVRETARRLRIDDAPPSPTDAPSIPDSPTDAPIGKPTPLRARRSRLWLAAAAVISLGVVLALAYDGGSSIDEITRSRAEVAPPPRSIAVLPFESLGTAPENQYFARGMHAAILTDLTNLADLVVTSRTSVMGYEDTDRSAPEIGEELGVAYVVEGSVQRSRHRIRVTARLTDTRRDETVWGERFDRTYTSEAVFEIQTEIAREVAEALQARISEREADRLAHRPTGSLTAYDLYLRGRTRLEAGNVDSTEDAIRMFRVALREDPEFALAHAGIAEAYRELGELTGSKEVWRDSVAIAAERALELEPDLPEAHLVLASHFGMAGRSDRSLEHVRRVLEVRPNDARAASWMSRYYHVEGDLLQALCWAERARELEPTDVQHHLTMSLAYNSLGDRRAAEEAARRGLEIAPDDLRLYPPLVAATLARGDRPAAVRAYRTARSLASFESTDLGYLAEVELKLGMPDSARIHLETLVRRGRLPFHSWHYDRVLANWRSDRRDRALRLLEPLERVEQRALEQGIAGYFPLLNLARIHVLRGEDERALDRLEDARERGAYLRLFKSAPLFQRMRGNPRFRRLMERAWTHVDSVVQRLEVGGCAAVRRVPVG